MQQELENENEIILSVLKHDEIKSILREEKKLYRIKKETNALLCKVELFRIIKLYLLQIPKHLSYTHDEKTKLKLLKIAEHLPFKLIHNNLESIDKKACKINQVVVSQQNEDQFCSTYINKRIVTCLKKNELKIKQLLGK